MNHSWKDNTCTRCGVKREKKRAKVLIDTYSAMSEYEISWGGIFVYRTGLHYGPTGFKRPKCKQQNNG